VKEVDISIIVPVYRTAEFIPSIIQLLHEDCNKLGIEYELIFINDNSPDESRTVLEKLSESFEPVRFIELGENVGQHKAILSGLRVAKGHRMIVMDGDLQDDPAHLSTLIQSNRAGATFVKRLGQYESIGRLLFSFMVKGVIQSITGLHRKAGTYFIVDRETVERIIQVSCPSPFITILVAFSAPEITYVSAKRHRRMSGQSAYSMRKLAASTWNAFSCLIFCITHRSKLIKYPK